MPAPSKRPAPVRHQPRTGRTNGQSAALDIAWRALDVARDVKGLAMARNGTVLKVNTQLARLLGCSPASLEGKSMFGDLIERPRRQSLRKSMTRWTTILAAGTGARIPVEVTRERLKIEAETVEVYAIRDLRRRQEDALTLKRQSTALQERDEELRAQSQRFEMAVTSLSQGVCVFDADHRLVICNEPYRRMYGLSPDQARPGTTLREILEQRIASGLYSGPSPEDYIRERSSVVVLGAAAVHTHTFSDGRIIRLGHHPIASGGWVALHEDVTDQQALNDRLEQQNRLLKEQEHQLRLQNLHLDAALNNMSQGLVLFDKDRRVVICNRRYMEIYGLTK